MSTLKEYIIQNINLENLFLSAKLSLVVAPFISFISPVQHLFLSLLVLAFFDILTGIIKNRIYKKQPITSRALLQRKPFVFLMWSLGLLTMLNCDVFLMEIGITGNWAAKSYCVFYGLFEVISILENLAECGLPGAQNIIKILKGKLPSEIQDSLKKEDKDHE